MRIGPRSTAFTLGCLSLISLVVACSTGSGRVLLPDGSYQLTCEGVLSTCLVQMEKTCAADGYEVLRATEKRERAGPIEISHETVRSEAVVRCRHASPVFSFASSAPPPAPSATEAPPPLPDHAPLPPLNAPPAAGAPATPAASAAPSAAPASSSTTPPPPDPPVAPATP